MNNIVISLASSFHCVWNKKSTTLYSSAQMSKQKKSNNNNNNYKIEF